jgi:hypothetical protein
MERVKSLSRGPKLVLVAGPLLFVSLFLTWQKVEVDFGPAGRANYHLDGFDVWGLQIALLVVAVVSLIVVVHLTDTVLPEDVPWNKVIFALGNAVFFVTLVKNVTDAGSTWTSYVFLLFAALVAVGSYLSWSEARAPEPPPAVGYGRQYARSTSPTA